MPTTRILLRLFRTVGGLFTMAEGLSTILIIYAGENKQSNTVSFNLSSFHNLKATNARQKPTLQKDWPLICTTYKDLNICR